jgi:hypothetical protein
MITSEHGADTFHRFEGTRGDMVWMNGSHDLFFFLKLIAQSFPPPQLQHFNQNFHNPFIASHTKGLVEGRMQGHLRGWAVYDYDFVRTNRRWGMNGLRLTFAIVAIS